MKSRVGPNPSSSSPSTDVPLFGFFAFPSTPFACNCFVSAVLSQNVGTCVEKSVVCVAFGSPGGYATFVVNVPLIVSAFDEIDFTFPASTWLRKYGLNGIPTRFCPDDCVIKTETQLIASRTNNRIQKPRHRCGGAGLCSSGIPRPSGAGATRHRPLSCGIGAGGTALLVSVSSMLRSFLSRPPLSQPGPGSRRVGLTGPT